MSFSDNLMDNLNKINVKLSEKEVNKLYLYMKEVLEWNEKINLTAITNEEDFVLKHFVDSLTVLKYINSGDKVIDIGTGAGFPGIPLKIANDKIEVTLMDSLNKRILFLNNVIQKLELKNIQAIHSRAEELGRNVKYREKFDVVVSRAVANLSTLVEYMLPFVKVGGKCICMKGANVREELKEAENAINELGGEVIQVENLMLPNSDYERNIIVIEKKLNTKNKYPRKAGIPSKMPII